MILDIERVVILLLGWGDSISEKLQCLSPCRLNVYALNFNAIFDYLVGFFTKE